METLVGYGNEQATLRISGAEVTTAGVATSETASTLPTAVAPAIERSRTFLNMIPLWTQAKKTWGTPGSRSVFPRHSRLRMLTLPTISDAKDHETVS